MRGTTSVRCSLVGALYVQAVNISPRWHDRGNVAGNIFEWNATIQLNLHRDRRGQESQFRPPPQTKNAVPLVVVSLSVAALVSTGDTIPPPATPPYIMFGR